MARVRVLLLKTNTREFMCLPQCRGMLLAFWSPKPQGPYVRLVPTSCPLPLLFQSSELWPASFLFPCAAIHSSTWVLVSPPPSTSPRILEWPWTTQILIHPQPPKQGVCLFFFLLKELHKTQKLLQENGERLPGGNVAY